MSDLAKALQKLSGSAQLVWLAHPYPPGSEVYEFLSRPETLKDIQKTSPNLCLGLGSSFQLLVDDYTDGVIKPTELVQKIEDFQRDEKSDVSPAVLAQLIMNAQKAGIKLQFFEGPKLHEFDQAHMQEWLDNAAQDRVANAGILGLLSGRVLNNPRVENEMITDALKDPKSYLGKAIADKLHWVNRGQVEVAENLLERLNGKSAIVVYPAETLGAVHNFDFALAQAALVLEAGRRGEATSISLPKELEHWTDLARHSPPAGIVQRLDLMTAAGSAAPKSRVEQKLEQAPGALPDTRSELIPTFSVASGRADHLQLDGLVEVPAWQDEGRALANTAAPAVQTPSLLHTRFQPKAD